MTEVPSLLRTLAPDVGDVMSALGAALGADRTPVIGDGRDVLVVGDEEHDGPGGAMGALRGAVTVKAPLPVVKVTGV